MDLFELVKVLLRRWYVVVPIGLLTITLAVIVQTRVAAEYEAVGQLVFETPDLDASAGTRPAIDPVALAENVALDDAAAGREFTVSALGGTNYAVSTVAPSLEEAVADAESVVDQLAEQIRAVQEAQGVPTAELVELRLISQAAPQPTADESFLAEARMFLYDPVAATANPYGPNAATGRLLEVAVTSDAGLIEFQRRIGGGVEFRVGQQARDAAPLVQVITTGSDPAQVLKAFYVVRDMLVEELRAREQRAGVLPSQQLSLQVIDAPLGVVDNSPPVDRATAGVVGLGGMLALGLAFGVEGVSRRRRARREASVDPDGTAFEPRPTDDERRPPSGSPGGPGHEADQPRTVAEHEARYRERSVGSNDPSAGDESSSGGTSSLRPAPGIEPASDDDGVNGGPLSPLARRIAGR